MCPWLTMPTSGKAQPMQTRAQAAARWPLDPPHLPRSPKPSITISGVGQTGSSPPLSASSLPAYSPIIIGMKLVYLVLYFSPPHLLFSCFSLKCWYHLDTHTKSPLLIDYLKWSVAVHITMTCKAEHLGGIS